MLAIFDAHEFQTRLDSVKRNLRGWTLIFGIWGVVVSGALADGAPSTFDVQVSGSGPAVILIPGLSCSGAIWDDTVGYLQDRYQCHVLSLKGFGGTSPLRHKPDSLLPKVRDEIIAYARELGRPAIVGHSLGGVLAMAVAAEAPDLPRSLVIVDSAPFLAGGFGAKPETVDVMANSLGEKMKAMSPEDFSAAQSLAIRTMVNSEAQAEKLSELVNRSDKETVIQALTELVRTDLRQDISRIKCPVLVILAGITSSSLSADAQTKSREQYSALPGARILFFEQARHFIMYDEPESFRAELVAALAGPGNAGNALRENQTP